MGMIGQHEILYSPTDFMADGRDEGGEEKARQMVVKSPQQPTKDTHPTHYQNRGHAYFKQNFTHGLRLCLQDITCCRLEEKRAARASFFRGTLAVMDTE